MRFTFIDLFAGIGGFRIPLEKLGGECLGYSEVDSNAISVYRDNYDTVGECCLGDVTTIHTLPWDIDLIVGGVPCQPWSVAGKQKGFNDKRGKLWFDTIRIVELNRPKFFIFENVKGLLSKAHKSSFDLIVQSLTNIGYSVYHKVLNTVDFGIPQNRERIFLVGVRRDLDNGLFTFPETLGTKTKLYELLDDLPRSQGLYESFTFCDTRNSETCIHSWDITPTTDREKLICLAILNNRRKKRYGTSDNSPLTISDLTQLIPDIKVSELDCLVDKQIIKCLNGQGYVLVNSKNSVGIKGIYRVILPHATFVPTLTASDSRDCIVTAPFTSGLKSEVIQKVCYNNSYRFFTVSDCSKLQGFPEWFKPHRKDSVAKRQFGNSVSVPVIYHLANSLISTGVLPA